MSTALCGSRFTSSLAKVRDELIIVSISEMSDRILPSLILVFYVLGKETHSCERRTQIVGDGGEHLRSFIDEVLQARLHLVECARDSGIFRYAHVTDRRRLALPAELFGGGGQLGERSDKASGQPDREPADQQQSSDEQCDVSQKSYLFTIFSLRDDEPRLIRQLHPDCETRYHKDVILNCGPGRFLQQRRQFGKMTTPGFDGVLERRLNGSALTMIRPGSTPSRH